MRDEPVLLLAIVFLNLGYVNDFFAQISFPYCSLIFERRVRKSVFVEGAPVSVQLKHLVLFGLLVLLKLNYLLEAVLLDIIVLEVIVLLLKILVIHLR